MKKYYHTPENQIARDRNYSGVERVVSEDFMEHEIGNILVVYMEAPTLQGNKRYVIVPGQVIIISKDSSLVNPVVISERRKEIVALIRKNFDGPINFWDDY